MDEIKKQKCDFCGKKDVSTEAFSGRLGHVIYACKKCVKERTGNRTEEDHIKMMNR